MGGIFGEGESLMVVRGRERKAGDGRAGRLYWPSLAGGQGKKEGRKRREGWGKAGALRHVGTSPINSFIAEPGPELDWLHRAASRSANLLPRSSQLQTDPALAL